MAWQMLQQLDRLVGGLVLIVNVLDEKRPRGKQGMNTRQRASESSIISR